MSQKRIGWRKKITYTSHIAWQIRLGLDKQMLANEEQLEVAKHLLKQIKEDIEDDPRTK